MGVKAASANSRSVRGKGVRVGSQVEALALRLGSGAKLPTVRELCLKFGVATNTLVRSLDDLERRGIVDRKHGSGLFVSRRATCRNIGLVFGKGVFDSGASPVNQLLLRHCLGRASQHNERFSFYLDLPEADNNGDEALGHHDLIEDLNYGRLHGLLLICSDTPARAEWRKRWPLPTAASLPCMRGDGIVGIDYASVVAQGVAELARQGCRRIGLLTVLGCHRGMGFHDDLTAYRSAIQSAGLPLQDAWIWDRVPVGAAEEDNGSWSDFGRRAIEDMFTTTASGVPADERPDGLVITDDMMAAGAIDALHGLGIHVGTDLRIATHANAGSPVLARDARRITRLQIDPAEVAQDLFDLLEAAMAGQQPGQRLVRPTCITP
jgi:DNA-binding LacI/PurR family transcriptional regulator